MKVATVIAHFDYRGRFDSSFIRQVKHLQQLTNVVVVVSCSKNTNAQDLPPQTILIERPNYGYDFFSYRVGIEYLVKKSINFDQIILTNSSYYVLDAEIFSLAVKSAIQLCTPMSVVGFVVSKQIQTHLQSWFLVFDKSVITKKTIFSFFENIRLHSNKQEVILNYELGLSSILVKSGFTLKSVYNSRNPTKLADKNPMFAACYDVFTQCGVIKAEKLRQASQLELENFKIPEEIISSVLQTKHFYEQSIQTTSLNWLSYNRTNYKTKVAVVLHLFYPDLSYKIASKLRNITEPFDIFISTTDPRYISTILNYFGPVANHTYVCTVKNQGRDVLPFLKINDSVNFSENYDFVLKIHGKKSKYSNKGEEWRDDLFDALFGSKEVVDKTISLLTNPQIGMVGPHNHFLTDPQYWGSNQQSYLRIANILGIREDCLDLGFFAGTMFWIKTKLLEKLKGLQNKIQFEDESGQRDGTQAHALERLFVPICHSEGFIVTSIELMGKDEISTGSNFKLFV